MLSVWALEPKTLDLNPPSATTKVNDFAPSASLSPSVQWGNMMALSLGVTVRTVLVSVSEGPRRVSCTESVMHIILNVVLGIKHVPPLGLASTNMLFHRVQ